MIGDLLKKVFASKDKPPTEEEAKLLARHEDPSVRARLAGRGDLRPELLYFLAEDQSADVRRTVATNDATPAQANLLLAKDQDETVRADLAQKIGRLVPNMSSDEKDKARRLTIEALEVLAQDQIPKIRQILAETLKDVANAPPEVIRRLARDAEIAVAAPILCYSPVLTDQDLLDIIQSSPIDGALSAISKRDGVSSAVADAIAATNDVDAVAVLLANPSAQIREETLDSLVERSIDVEAWHHPLVHRPKLSPKSTQKLARFVASHLLQALASRNDLDPDAAQAVAAIVKKRLEELEATGTAKTEAHKAANEAIALERAKSLFGQGQLSETVVDTALAGGDADFVVAALALLAKLPVDVVKCAVTHQSAKGIIAVVWQAGLSMALAVELQSRLLHLPSPRIIRSGPGGFPMTPSEMAWQLEFLDGR